MKVMVRRIGVAEPEKVSLPASVDLTAWCSPIENQDRLGSCAVNAGVGLVEYYERRAFGRHIDASRLFLYKATRDLLHWTGDRGAFLRTTMGAMVLFGVPRRGERILGGHAIVAVGFDDEIKIKNTTCGIETTGALLIRNSWGTVWGR